MIGRTGSGWKKLLFTPRVKKKYKGGMTVRQAQKEAGYFGSVKKIGKWFYWK